VDFQWDPAKARANLAKHGIHFADAVLEDDSGVSIRDPFSEEERWITVGSDAIRRVLVVVYVWRGDNVRLMSALRATRRERKHYEGRYET